MGCHSSEHSSAELIASMNLMLLRRMSRRLSLLASVSSGCSGKTLLRRRKALRSGKSHTRRLLSYSNLLLAELLRPQLLFPLRSGLGFSERSRRGNGRFGCLSAIDYV